MRQKQSGFVRLTFLGYDGNVSKVRGVEGSKPVTVLATETGEKAAARRLCSKQKSYILLLRPIFWFRQP